MATTHHSIPASSLTSFVAREAELRDLVALVSTRRLVTITGQAGVGKSRVATRVAEILRRSLGGSIVLVDMAGVGSDRLLEQLANALGTQDATAAEVVHTLGDRPRLIVVDGLDDPARASPVIEHLLRSTSETRLLITTRRRTAISGEGPYVISPLPLPSVAAVQRTPEAAQDNPSFALLMQRIVEADPSFDTFPALADDLVTVSRSTDGVPRFIEAAARAVSTLGVQEAAIAVRENATVLDAFLPPDSRALTSNAVIVEALATRSSPW